MTADDWALIPGLEALSSSAGGWWALVAGLAVAVGVFAVVRIVGAKRDRALALAGLMTEQLRRANARLEARVAIRTRALAETNRRLRAEIAEREGAERARARALEQERAARAEAEAASRAKDEFLAVLSHELRTPLNAIQGWAHILERDGLETGTVQRGAAVIQRNVGAQERLIENLLDSAHLAAGEIELASRPVRLAGIVDDAVARLAPVAAEKGVALRAEVAGIARDAVVMGDPARLDQVVWHLISNGLKFTPPGGAVHVRLERSDGVVRLCVTDTGEGIAAEFLPHVFAPFRQADASSRRRAGGLGVGLSLVKSLVELHGGAIAATSAGPGRGTSFVLTLPDTEAPASSPAARCEAESREAARGQLAGCTLLVIDDHVDTLEAMQAVLELEGARVQVARSVTEALDRLSDGREPPDVILCDIELPGEDGYAFLEKLRAREARADADARPIPVAAVTAYAGERHRERALAAGFFAHIVKPIGAARLVAAVRPVCHARASRAGTRIANGAGKEDSSMKRKVHGEGNYEAAREYDEQLKRHIDSADTEAEARRAAPRDEAEAEALKRAETKGKRRLKEEDPALRAGAKRPDQGARHQK